MTVFHLLTMTAGKDVSVFSDKTKGNWVKQFFESKWAFAPGEGWRYISENTYMCSATDGAEYARLSDAEAF